MAALLIPADSLMRDTATPRSRGCKTAAARSFGCADLPSLLPQLIDLIHNRLQLINRPHNIRPKKTRLVFHQLRKAIIIRKAHYSKDRLAQLQLRPSHTFPKRTPASAGAWIVSLTVSSLATYRRTVFSASSSLKLFFTVLASLHILHKCNTNLSCYGCL